MRFQAPRGTEDVLPSQVHAWQLVERHFREFAALYGYGEIRTPTFEEYELFVRTSGDTSDIVSKEMYDFFDKGGRHLALKPESTAPAMRALIEHNLCPQGSVSRLCYVSSSHFRYDRPQKGRLRQHHQCGIELIGSESAAADAEVIEFGVRFLERLGLTGLRVKLNSIGRAECRHRYREALLAYASPLLESSSEELQEKARKNPLRLLDMKDPKVQEAMREAPSILDFLEPESAERFAELQRLLSNAGIAFEVDPGIVRGLDYYTETVFETQSESLGAQSTVFAGGRYDDLIKQLGGAALPAVGFGLGVERLLLVLEAAQLMPAAPAPRMFVVYSPGLKETALDLCRTLRAAGLVTYVDIDERSMKSQLRQADKSGAKWVAILGEEEVAGGTVSLKDMETGEQRSLRRGDLVEALR